jgi:TIR domain/Pentapeptide repeats (8 copies)
MADQQLLNILKKRVRTWNQWQRRNANTYPDFSLANLEDTQLSFAQLQRANLHGANLSHTILCNANLRRVDLSGADLRYANLSRADLSHADLTDADLSHANLSATNLNGTLFRGTILENANLSHALLQNTAFMNVNLSTVRGIDTVYPLGPSTIGVDTLTRSKNLSESVLRNLKIHENLITSLHERGEAPLEYASVFISYASEDFAFVQKLRDALQQEGVWCWFAPDALRGGDFFKERIDQAIKQCDKLLVIFSKSARASTWVRYEVELARQKEKKQNPTVIIPISIDTTFMDDPGWAAFLRDKRHMRDFREWRESLSDDTALRLLLRDLQVSV